MPEVQPLSTPAPPAMPTLNKAPYRASARTASKSAGTPLQQYKNNTAKTTTMLNNTSARRLPKVGALPPPDPNRKK